MKLTFTERFRALAQNPIEAIKRMGITEGQTVVDIGAGTGYFTIPAAETVGAKGMVYSVEPDPTRSQRIQERVTSEGLPNVRVITTGAERLVDIPTESLDLAFSAFTLHHFNDRQVGLSEIRRVLRKGGVFYVWDRVPGSIIRHGTRPDELPPLAFGFTSFEQLGSGRTLRARFTK